MWLLTGEINQNSDRTRQSRREVIDKLAWFMEHRGLDDCNTTSLRPNLSNAGPLLPSQDERSVLCCILARGDSTEQSQGGGVELLRRRH